jgi:hypothetical protein
MGLRPTRRRLDDDRAADRAAMARALIQEADGRLHGLARFLERTGLDRDEELVRRLAARAERMARGGRNHEPRPQTIGFAASCWVLRGVPSAVESLLAG